MRWVNAEDRPTDKQLGLLPPSGEEKYFTKAEFLKSNVRGTTHETVTRQSGFTQPAQRIRGKNMSSSLYTFISVNQA